MERRQIGLKLAMDQLGLEVKVETFEDRLILQKAVYLAQADRVSLGYYYRWYLRGPYCPALAEDGFAVSAELAQNADDANGWALDAISSQKLGRLRVWMGGLDRPSLARKLELLASIHFLIDRRQVPNRDPKTISDVLLRFDKVFSEGEVASAIGEIIANGLLS
jgi:hypothetical protein